MSPFKRPLILWPMCLLALSAAFDAPVGHLDGAKGINDPDSRRLESVEHELLSLVNRERAEGSRHTLRRDAGADRIILWHVSMMADRSFLSHQDVMGRDTGDRIRDYAQNQQVRCSEIVQWWSGPPSGRAHYDGYYDSQTHHDAYMERGRFNLGGTTLTGLAAVAGSGPAGTEYEGVQGSYTGMLFCDHSISLVVDPFAD